MQSITGKKLEELAKEAILALLAKAPGITAEIKDASGRQEWDFEVDLSSQQGHQSLLCQAKSRAWPNELHGVGSRLSKAAQQHPLIRSTPVFIAPYFSPQAIDTCHELGLSWVDLAGNGELKVQGAYVKVLGQPNPYKSGRGTATLYSPKSSSVAHALLLAPIRKWTTEDLAKAAQVSLGQVASVKKLLQTNRWLRSSYGETTLTEPRKLLDDWALHYKPKRTPLQLFTLDSPAQLEKRIETTLPNYAFTEFSAAQRYAPYTRHQRVAFYVTNWRDDLSKQLGLKHGDGAANVTIYETGEPLAFVEEIDGSRCISPIVTYLDLKLLSGRGQDAAEHLLETVIEQRWK